MPGPRMGRGFGRGRAPLVYVGVKLNNKEALEPIDVEQIYEPQIKGLWELGHHRGTDHGPHARPRLLMFPAQAVATMQLSIMEAYDWPRTRETEIKTLQLTLELPQLTFFRCLAGVTGGALMRRQTGNSEWAVGNWVEVASACRCYTNVAQLRLDKIKDLSYDYDDDDDEYYDDIVPIQLNRRDITHVIVGPSLAQWLRTPPPPPGPLIRFKTTLDGRDCYVVVEIPIPTPGSPIDMKAVEDAASTWSGGASVTVTIRDSAGVWKQLTVPEPPTQATTVSRAAAGAIRRKSDDDDDDFIW